MSNKLIINKNQQIIQLSINGNFIIASSDFETSKSRIKKLINSDMTASFNATTCNFDGTQAPLCEIGATFSFPFEWLDSNNTNISFSSYTFKMQVRNGSGVLITELTLDNGGVILDSNGTTATLYISDDDTSDFNAGQYEYDLLLTDSVDDSKIRLLKGSFIIDKVVTV